MNKNRALSKVKARLERLRTKIKSQRKQIIARAADLLEMGFDSDEVFDELRDEWIDSAPLWAQKADDFIDFTKILPGIIGEIFEMIDGLMIEHTLRLFVTRAERRHRRGRMPTIGALRDSGFTTLADVPDRDWALKQVVKADDDADDDIIDEGSALNVDAGGWGLDGSI